MMMTQVVCAVYDAAASAYLEPFFCPTVEYAARIFREACEKEGHQFNKFPEDYTLFQIGFYDVEHGELSPLAALHPLARAIEFKPAPSVPEGLREVVPQSVIEELGRLPLTADKDGDNA